MNSLTEHLREIATQSGWELAPSERGVIVLANRNGAPGIRQTLFLNESFFDLNGPQVFGVRCHALVIFDDLQETINKILGMGPTVSIGWDTSSLRAELLRGELLIGIGSQTSEFINSGQRYQLRTLQQFSDDFRLHIEEKMRRCLHWSCFHDANWSPWVTDRVPWLWLILRAAYFHDKQSPKAWRECRDWMRGQFVGWETQSMNAVSGANQRLVAFTRAADLELTEKLRRFIA